MKAGRELDTLVAEKVMGLVIESLCTKIRCHEAGGEVLYCGCGWRGGRWDNEEFRSHSSYVKPYSTSLVIAWEIVEKINSLRLGWYVGISVGPDNYNVWVQNDVVLNSPHYYGFTSSTVPHLICLAALKVMGIDR